MDARFPWYKVITELDRHLHMASTRNKYQVTEQDADIEKQCDTHFLAWILEHTITEQARSKL